MKKIVKTTPMFRSNDFERNYDRHCGTVDYCICCGRKLNPKTMKQAQAIEPGDFVSTDCGEIPDIVNDNIHQVSMGWYPVGPICYREIRRRLNESNETREIIFND